MGIFFMKGLPMKYTCGKWKVEVERHYKVPKVNLVSRGIENQCNVLVLIPQNMMEDFM
jgi:hypothetical protein